MTLFDNDIRAFIEFPDGTTENADILLGIHIMEGQCEGCGSPAVGVQVGFLFFTITITITKSHRCQS